MKKEKRREERSNQKERVARGKRIVGMWGVGGKRRRITTVGKKRKVLENKE